MCVICEGGDLDGFKKLNCNECQVVTEIPHVQGLESLYCNGTNITEIPAIEGLKLLYCYNTNITAIPAIKGLKNLNCYGTNITEVPHIQGLKTLICHDTNITEVPHMQRLKYLYCSGTNITAIPDIEGCYIIADNCMWLEARNTIPVIKLQQWVRRTILRRKLMSIWRQLTPIYYAPNMKGGYFDRQSFTNYFSSI